MKVDTPVEGCEIEKAAGTRHLRRHPPPPAEGPRRRLRRHALLPRRALPRPRRRPPPRARVGPRAPRPHPPPSAIRADTAPSISASRAARRASAPPGKDLRFHRSHYEMPVVHHTGGRHEYSAGHRARCRRGDQPPQAEDPQEDGGHPLLKGVIGLTNEKYWLPHFTAGDPSAGGDEYDRRQARGRSHREQAQPLPVAGRQLLIARAPRVGGPPKVIDGSREGNHTLLWRTILDLNRILFFADKDGKLRDTAAALPDHRRRHRRRRGRGLPGATPVEAGCSSAASIRPWSTWRRPGRVASIRRASADPRGAGGKLLPGGQLEALDEVLDGPQPTRRFKAPRSWPSIEA